MKSKNILTLAVALALAMILVPAAAGTAAENDSRIMLGDESSHIEWEDSGNSTIIRYFADGEAIEITAGPEAGDIIVTSSSGSETIDVSQYGTKPNKAVVVYGGSKESSTASSSITLKSGSVATIYGGGYSTSQSSSADVENAYISIEGGFVANAVYGGGETYSTVTNSTINMTGGHSVFVMGGGAQSNVRTPYGADNPYPSISGTAAITITGGNADYVMGGGQGYSLVNETTINFGGTAEAVEVIGSGSNGETVKSTINVSGGEISDYLFAVNRGTLVGDIEINVTGGTVANAYVGASQDSSNTTGTVTGSADLNISGGDVGRIYAGTGINDADVTFNVGDRIIYLRGGYAQEADTDYEISKEWNVSSGRLYIPYDSSLTLLENGRINISDGASVILDGTLAADSLNQISGDVQVLADGRIYHDVNGTKTAFIAPSDSQIKINGISGTINFEPNGSAPTAVKIDLVTGNFSIDADSGFTVTPDSVLTVGKNATLTIPEGKTLYMYGDMIVDGTLINNGSLQIVSGTTDVPNYPGVVFDAPAGSMTVNGNVINTGTLDVNNGTFTNNGTVSSTTPLPGVPGTVIISELPEGVKEGDTLIYNLDPYKTYSNSAIIVDNDIKNIIVNGNGARILGLTITVPDAGADVRVECLNFETRGLVISSADPSGQWKGDVTVRFNTFKNIIESPSGTGQAAAVSIFGNTGSTICIDQNIIDGVIFGGSYPAPNAVNAYEARASYAAAGIIVVTEGSVSDKSAILIYSNSLANIEGDAVFIYGQFENIHINDNLFDNWDLNNLSAGKAIEIFLNGYPAGVKISYNEFVKTYVEPLMGYGSVLSIYDWGEGDIKAVFEYNTLNLNNLPEDAVITDDALTYVYGEEEAVKNTVTFDLNGGSWILPSEGSFTTGGAPIDQPNVSPSRPGYVFAGWTLNGQAYDFSKPVTSDITLTAAWYVSECYYTVSFDTNGGSEIPNASVLCGSRLSQPANPVKENYSFAGWYCDAALTVPYDFSCPVYSSFTLYAKWNPAGEMCSVTFDSGNISVVTVPYGTPVSKPQDPSRENYTFTCWTLNGQAYDFSKPVTSNITLCANWTVGSYVQNGTEAVVTIDNASIAEAVKESSDSFVLADASAMAGVESVTISRSALESALEEMSPGGIKNVNIILPQGMLTMNAAVISSLLEHSGDSVSFAVHKVDSSELSSEQAAAVGDGIVYEISIMVGGEEISSFGGNKLKVSVAYDLAQGEDGSKLCMYYVDDAGNTEKINAVYENGYLTFETDHASYFAIGQDNAAAAEDTFLYYLLATVLILLIAVGIAAYFMRRKQTI